MVARYKPSNEARAATHPASADDYAKLAQAVVKAIALKQKDVYIRLPYFVALADDWPKGILVHKDSQHNTYKIKTFKAADWLYEHDYLPQDAKGIVASMRQVNILVNKIDRALDLEKHEEYNVGSVEVVDKEAQ